MNLIIVIIFFTIIYAVTVFYYTKKTYYEEYVKNIEPSKVISFKRAFFYNLFHIAWILSLF